MYKTDKGLLILDFASVVRLLIGANNIQIRYVDGGQETYGMEPEEIERFRKDILQEKG